MENWNKSPVERDGGCGQRVISSKTPEKVGKFELVANRKPGGCWKLKVPWVPHKHFLSDTFSHCWLFKQGLSYLEVASPPAVLPAPEPRTAVTHAGSSASLRASAGTAGPVVDSQDFTPDPCAASGLSMSRSRWHSLEALPPKKSNLILRGISKFCCPRYTKGLSHRPAIFNLCHLLAHIHYSISPCTMRTFMLKFLREK